MKSNFKKQIIIALLGIIILSSWFCSIREVLAFIKINPANPKIQISSLQKGLVGHWNLDSESYNSATNRFTDKSAYSNHGTSINAAVFAADRMGQADRAMTFNGTTDYVNAGNAASLNITGAITVEVWVKLNELNKFQNIVNKRNAYFYAPRIEANNQIMCFFFWDDATNTGELESSLAKIDDYNWHHIVISFSTADGYIRIYKDGVEKVNWSGYIGKKIAITTNNARIGLREFGGASEALNGSIDEVRIYNRALSAAEILQSYNSYRPKISAGSLQKGLVLDMPMDSGYTKSATVLTDRTPYSNNGTAVNGPVIGADYTTFDGLDDYVNAGNGASLNITNAITVEAWVSPIQDKRGAIVMDQYGAGASGGVPIEVYREVGGQLYFNSYYNSLGDAIWRSNPGGNIPLNTWSFVTATFDKNLASSAGKVYINGIQVGSGNDQTPLPVLEQIRAIGNYGNNGGGGTWTFDGSIDEVRIYNRALSADEIQLSYDKSKGRH